MDIAGNRADVGRPVTGTRIVGVDSGVRRAAPGGRDYVPTSCSENSRKGTPCKAPLVGGKAMCIGHLNREASRSNGN